MVVFVASVMNKRITNKPIILGGRDAERLYLKDLTFRTPRGRKVHVARTMIPGVDMEDLVARHRGRYGPLLLFSRPGKRVLDFPCGSGYAAELVKDFGVIYEGKDFDSVTITYAQKLYGGKRASFGIGDLCAPKLKSGYYDVIACIEGLEHIQREFQGPLIKSLYTALRQGGTLIISSPESNSRTSGPSATNPYHLWELTKKDFLALLHKNFKKEHVELVTYRSVLSNGERTTCFYGFCHK